MKLKEMLLDALMEECAEVIVRASKALRFGLDEIQPGQALTNRERLEAELNDLAGVLAMLPGTGVLSREWKNEAASEDPFNGDPESKDLKTVPIKGQLKPIK